MRKIILKMMRGEEKEQMGLMRVIKKSKILNKLGES
jgi:hypothetical protein